MSFTKVIRVSSAALGLALGGVCFGQAPDNAELQQLVAELRLRNKVLEQGIAEANRAEKQASEQLADVKQRLEALGHDLLDGGDDRLVQATADLQVLSDRVSSLEGSAMRLSGALSEFLRGALASDPDSRLRVETAMRELDSVLGLRQKPAPNAQGNGTAGSARVMSIDSQSGLLVFNIGEQQGTRIGSTYRLYRGDQAYGTAIIADVRRRVCGAFVEALDLEQGPVRQGDRAILITE